MNDNLPNWTDVAQALFGLVGMTAALITLFKLVSRDKDRESEIKSLSTIAEQLYDLQKINDRRYIQTKTPRLEIEIKHDEFPTNYRFIHFKNLNHNSNITNFNRIKNKTGMVSSITSYGNVQEFSFNIDAPRKGESKNIEMNYVVDERYFFDQNIMIHWVLDELILSPGNIYLVN